MRCRNNIAYESLCLLGDKSKGASYTMDSCCTVPPPWTFPSDTKDTFFLLVAAVPCDFLFFWHCVYMYLLICIFTLVLLSKDKGISFHEH